MEWDRFNIVSEFRSKARALLIESLGLNFYNARMAVRDNSIAKGWREPDDTFGEHIALLHSELSEALEAFRDRGDFKPSYALISNGESPVESAKPIGVDSELADVFIRLMDVCDIFGIDLGQAVAEKMVYNMGRPYQHGGRTLNRPSARADAQPAWKEGAGGV